MKVNFAFVVSRVCCPLWWGYDVRCDRGCKSAMFMFNPMWQALSLGTTTSHNCRNMSSGNVTGEEMKWNNLGACNTSLMAVYAMQIYEISTNNSVSASEVHRNFFQFVIIMMWWPLQSAVITECWKLWCTVTNFICLPILYMSRSY